MRKIALATAALGFIALAGIASADEKVSTENSVKSESGTTITGKHKNIRTKKVVNADGTTTETKSETIAPKNEKRDMETRDNGVANTRGDDENKAQVNEKTEEHTTLTGKKQMKSTKKVERPDGTTTETTTTTTEPKK